MPMNRVRINTMAASTTTCFGILATLPVATGPHPLLNRRRRISPEAGRALEILGHAIEYLTDEFVHEGGLLSLHNERLEAVRLLMERNRQIYFACPEIPTWSERFHAFLNPRSA